MKGFLQRIAATAFRPQTRLKPLVGSIYAGELAADFAEEKSSLVVDRPGEIGPRASPQPEAESIDTRVTHRDAASPRGTPVRQAPSSARPSPPSLASVVAQVTAPRQTAPLPATDTSERGGSRQTAAESGASASLSAQHTVRTEERSPPPATPPPASRELQRSEPRLPQPSPGQKAAQATVGEDVRIHIGRIEVIAVPPPNASSPPTSRSRATSLEDYLRRGNGGAR